MKTDQKSPESVIDSSQQGVYRFFWRRKGWVPKSWYRKTFTADNPVDAIGMMVSHAKNISLGGPIQVDHLFALRVLGREKSDVFFTMLEKHRSSHSTYAFVPAVLNIDLGFELFGNQQDAS